MCERDALHSSQLRDGDHVFDGAVPPANLSFVFRGAILRIVDQKIGARYKLSVTFILPADITDAVGERPRMRLVITGVNDGHPVRLQPIAQRHRRMVQVLRTDLDVGEGKDAFGEIVIADSSAELL